MPLPSIISAVKGRALAAQRLREMAAVCRWRGNMDATRRTLSVCALLIVSALVVGCGVQSTSAPASTHVQSTATATAPTPQPTVDPALLARCAAQPAPIGDITQAGEVLLFKSKLALGYPAVQLPDQTPLKPLQVGTQVSGNALRTGVFPGAHPVNPGGIAGTTRTFDFVATICNGSASQSHTVQSVSVRIAALSPYSGKVNVWPGCDTAFSQQHPDVHTGGCGGGVETQEQFHALFPSGAQAGATVVAAQTGFSPPPDDPSIGPLPVHLAPGKGLSFLVSISIPDMVGTYSIGVGFQVDSAQTAFGQSADPMLFAPVAHTFTGSGCNTPAMLAQIPAATTPESYYICPQQ